ncbi:hypothetical protein BJF79_03490 [Actinomadura sp. CNU-125]|uniref:hypothetical protein n=1 Tax=Actinomadura sp. CNU-125 TaxID=1904961 RepID=UPI000962B304|nr:hypothetical protein [Actinomadura sp. CNU-125]OLT12977.1 hypothetical protein BJF79_03490 [Actinomadura sp. CNU-125]
MTDTNIHREQVTATTLDGSITFQGTARLSQDGEAWSGDIITDTLPASVGALETFYDGAHITFPSGETVEVEVPNLAINTFEPDHPFAALARLSGIAAEADGRLPAFALNVRLSHLPGHP